MLFYKSNNIDSEKQEFFTEIVEDHHRVCLADEKINTELIDSQQVATVLATVGCLMTAALFKVIEKRKDSTLYSANYYKEEAIVYPSFVPENYTKWLADNNKQDGPPTNLAYDLFSIVEKQVAIKQEEIDNAIYVSEKKYRRLEKQYLDIKKKKSNTVNFFGEDAGIKSIEDIIVELSDDEQKGPIVKWIKSAISFIIPWKFENESLERVNKVALRQLVYSQYVRLNKTLLNLIKKFWVVLKSVPLEPKTIHPIKITLYKYIDQLTSLKEYTLSHSVLNNLLVKSNHKFYFNEQESNLHRHIRALNYT